MKTTKELITCPELLQYKASKRATPFNLIKYEFNYSENDKILIDDIIQKGEELGNQVNKGAANNAMFARDSERIKNNCIAGVLAEFVWKDYLNQEEELVKETSFNGANNQIDLEIIKNNKTIEVRSSFPRNGIEFAICHPTYEFDVIGPYANSYKPGEIQKSFYVRTLFPFESKFLLTNLKKSPFHVYLTGGATWDMMIDDNYSKTKDFIPDGEINPLRLTSKTWYKVVPFSKALDSQEMYELIKA